jgi:hypothetical protein
MLLSTRPNGFLFFTIQCAKRSRSSVAIRVKLSQVVIWAGGFLRP